MLKRNQQKQTRFIIGLVICCVVSVVSVGSPAYVHASTDRFKNVENATPQEIVNGMGNKLGRGAANVATGWGELPKQIYITTKEDGWGKGLIIGPFKGLMMTLVRTVAGVGEIVTFFVPFPGFYDPYFDPPYVWQKE